MNAQEIVDFFNMKHLPEGGWVHHTSANKDASMGSSVYLLIVKDEPSPWHRMAQTQVWHHYLGATVRLRMVRDKEEEISETMLGKNLLAGERPQFVVPGNMWRFAETQGEFTLVGCTESPGFNRKRFDLADTFFD